MIPAYFFFETGFEHIAVQMSSGHLLQPVQTLVATIILRSKMQIESSNSHKKQPAVEFCKFHLH